MDNKFQAITNQLLGISGFHDFMQSYNPRKSEEKPISLLIANFRNFREEKKQPLSQAEVFLLEKIESQLFEWCYQHHSNKLYHLDKSQTIGDDIMDNFREDWELSKSSRISFVDKEKQTYKTWTEFIMYEEHKDDGLILKYKDAYHPLIYSTLGRAIIASGNFSVGVPFIVNGFHYANNPFNPFWHSAYGVMGCAECMWEFIRLLSIDTIKNEFEEYYIKLFKLLFLYLSRSIALCEIENLVQGINCYKNRANLLRDNSTIFMSIFANSKFVFTIMDIQFISDYYCAYQLCCKCKVPYLGSEFLNDSLKMYRYGNLSYLNEDGGYQIIEDQNWLELVERGRIRANIVAENLITEMQEGKLKIPPHIVTEMTRKLYEALPFDGINNFNWTVRDF